MKRALAIVVLFMLLLCGCRSGIAITENLLSPPINNIDQERITVALHKHVGKRIKYKFSRTGDNRSAFIFADVDGDSSNEVLAFYCLDGVGENVRINLLDKVEDEWKSISDIEGGGVEVERVEVITSAKSKSDDIVVCWSDRENKKTFNVYEFSNQLTQSLSEPYTNIEFIDMDMNGELNIVCINTARLDDVGTVKMYSAINGSVSFVSGVALSDEVLTYTQISVGKLSDGKNAIFLDGIAGIDRYVTQIVYSNMGQLVNPLSQFMGLFSREEELFSRDIDKDGVFEVPSQYDSIHENISDQLIDNSLVTVSWNEYDGINITHTTESIVNTKDNWILLLPVKWAPYVTAKFNDGDSSTSLFYEDIEIVKLHKVLVTDVNADDTNQIVGRTNGYVYYYDIVNELTESGLAFDEFFSTLNSNWVIN